MILRFKEFIKEDQDFLSDTRYHDVLKKDIEDDDTLREYCPCEEKNSCDCEGQCDCDFCKLYFKNDDTEKDYIIYEPKDFFNTLSGKTDMGGRVGTS